MGGKLTNRGAPKKEGGRRPRRGEDDDTRQIERDEPAKTKAPPAGTGARGHAPSVKPAHAAKRAPVPKPALAPPASRVDAALKLPARDRTQELDMGDVEVLVDETELKGEPTKPKMSPLPASALQPEPTLTPEPIPEPTPDWSTDTDSPYHDDEEFDGSIFPSNPVVRLLKKLRRKS
jgi:hypothetical protein